MSGGSTFIGSGCDFSSIEARRCAGRRRGVPSVRPAWKTTARRWSSRCASIGDRSSADCSTGSMAAGRRHATTRNRASPRLRRAGRARHHPRQRGADRGGHGGRGEIVVRGVRIVRGIRTIRGVLSRSTSRTEGFERVERLERSDRYFTCLLTSLVISNMLTEPLPANTGFSAASLLIIRRFFWSWRPFFLM